MLYTDRDFISIDDLAGIDPDVIEVSSVECIPTEGDSSFVHQAIEEAANTIESNMQNFTTQYWNVNSFPNDVGIYPYGNTGARSRVKLGQIVVDSDTTLYASPLKRWVMYLALRNFYQIASNRKIDDKYAAKVKQIQTDIDSKYWPAFKAGGLPVVFCPVPCPGAKYEPYQGVFSASNVSIVASAGSNTGSTYDVAVTWTTDDNRESGPSETITIATEDNTDIKIDISGLVPPSGVTGWNIYAGPEGTTLFFQINVPLAETGNVATLPDFLNTTGTVVTRGQPKDQSFVFMNLLFRA